VKYRFRAVGNFNYMIAVIC